MKPRHAKQVLRSVIAIAMCTALSSPSWAILACGNSWTPTPPGGASGWGLTTFDASTGSIRFNQSDLASLFASFLSGGPAFSSSDYSLDCSIVLVPPTTRPSFSMAGGWFDQPVPASYACRINKAPTVDMTFVNNLRSQGYIVSISYPQTNSGTGIGIVTWAKLSSDFNVACPSVGVPAYDPNTGGLLANGCAVNNIGLAYVTGAGYQNQYAGSFGIDIANKMTAAGWSAADRANAAVVGLWGPHASVSAEACPLQGSHAYPTIMIGSFPTPVAPPALPPPPTVVNRGASSINFGQSGSVAGVGNGSSNTAVTQGEAAFDLISYCGAPSHDGKPRSDAWIRACIAAGSK
jgi:hypothetical protein